jgi:hypothetical protein
MKSALKIVIHFYLMLFSIGIAQSQNDTDTTLVFVNEICKARAISTFNMFREPSYIILGSGIGNLEPLIFESDIIPYFMLSLSNNNKWGIELSPQIILRMYNQESRPVQTPSFMPRVTFFIQFADKHDGKRDFFTYFSWMHYSNGQDGDFFNSDSTINTKTGSFYTNWVEGGVFLSRPDPKLIFITNYVKLYAAYSFMQEKNMDDVYGRLRFFLQIKSTVKLSRFFKALSSTDNTNKNYIFDQSIKVGWIASELNKSEQIDKKRIIFNYRLSFKPTFLKDVNIFIHYYYGQDYYNIHFSKQLNVIRFGISSKSNILF